MKIVIDEGEISPAEVTETDGGVVIITLDMTDAGKVADKLRHIAMQLEAWAGRDPSG